jgi:hypothetical protein
MLKLVLRPSPILVPSNFLVLPPQLWAILHEATLRGISWLPPVN